MNELEERVELAKADRLALDQLLRDYLPFLKKKLAENTWGLDYDDSLSIAMLTFAGCVRQYQPERGAFLSFAWACIKNRLLDEGRKLSRQAGQIIPFDELGQTEAAPAWIAYRQEEEKRDLAQEIRDYASRLEPLGITLPELAKRCPKHERSRKQCVALARAVSQAPAWRELLLGQGKLPQSELAKAFSLSVKTVEKHRKYIVALSVLMLGDYPSMQAYLQLWR